MVILKIPSYGFECQMKFSRFLAFSHEAKISNNEHYMFVFFIILENMYDES